jgi:biofilm PGA synthesis N-glycosyltransferase PgaC
LKHEPEQVGKGSDGVTAPQSGLTNNLAQLATWLHLKPASDDDALRKKYNMAITELKKLRGTVAARRGQHEIRQEQLNHLDAALVDLTDALTSLPRTAAGTASAARRNARTFYIPIFAKFVIAFSSACAWMGLSIWLSLLWLNDLISLLSQPVALFLVAFIAYVPGFMSAFLVVSLLLDRRPPRARLPRLPGITVLVPCYNEAIAAADTIRSLGDQEYPGDIEIMIIDDGSTDSTVNVARHAIYMLPPERRALFQLVTDGPNAGKAAALNRGLAMARYGLIVTVDADSWLRPNGLRRIVERYLSDPPDTRAVAGTILVRNSRKNWLTRVQEWDYFNGIAAVKRMQSMYHGTLVAQGAFSLYDAALLRALGGWPNCVGEDIVLSWAILKAGYRIGHCEDALMFTNVPETFRQFAQQRIRWSRGLMEAFTRHSRLLWAPRMSTLFIWWNLLFLPMDIAYTFGFIPGLILALFGYYYIAGVMTLVLLPLAAICNGVMLSIQGRMFQKQNMRIRQNILGFMFYALGYSLVLQPVSIWGYFSELVGLRKHWGTK